MNLPWSKSQLSSAEKKLCEAVENRSLEFVEAGAGDPYAGASWGPDRTIRGTLIKQILLGLVTPNPCLVRVAGARISEDLNLEAARTLCPLDLRECYFDELINFEQLDAPAIYLTKCNIPKGIRASQIHVRGNFWLDDSTIRDDVGLTSARIDGQLGMDRTHLCEGAELNAGAIVVQQGAYFRSLRAEGRVRLAGARVVGKLDLTRAELTKSEDGTAMSAPRVNVSGNLLMGDGFRAEGAVDLTNGTITGDLRCSGGNFMKGATGKNRERCLDLARVDVRQHILLNNGFRATGTVYLVNAAVGGRLDCEGGKFENSTDTAIYAAGIKVGGDVLLTKPQASQSAEESGFSVTGKVVLAGASIAAKLDCSGGRFLADRDSLTVLNARGMTAGSLIFGDEFVTQGKVDLRRVTLNGQLRNISSVDPEKVLLAGLTYKSIEDSSDLGGQIKWLRKVDYSPQVYRQLAAIYAAAGEEEKSKSVLVAGRNERQKRLSWYSRIAQAILRATVNYGYSPFRVLAWIAALEIFGGFWFGSFRDSMILAPIYTGASVNGAGQAVHPVVQPNFNPWIYTADQLLPVVDLRQGKIWIPTGASEWISVVLTIAGWILVTALIVGLGSVFRSDYRNEIKKSVP